MTASKRLAHIVYWAKDRENQQGEWHPIGGVWAHADGKGFEHRAGLAVPGRPHHAPSAGGEGQGEGQLKIRVSMPKRTRQVLGPRRRRLPIAG